MSCALFKDDAAARALLLSVAMPQTVTDQFHQLMKVFFLAPSYVFQ
jgi:hypothetical protein